MAMTWCVASGCRNFTTPYSVNDALGGSNKPTFFTFPLSNPKLLQDWMTNLEMRDCEATELTKLCSDHFEESCMVKVGNSFVLKYNAVPTKYLGPSRSFPKKDKKSTSLTGESTVSQSTTSGSVSVIQSSQQSASTISEEPVVSQVQQPSSIPAVSLSEKKKKPTVVSSEAPSTSSAGQNIEEQVISPSKNIIKPLTKVGTQSVVRKLDPKVYRIIQMGNDGGIYTTEASSMSPNVTIVGTETPSASQIFALQRSSKPGLSLLKNNMRKIQTNDATTINKGIASALHNNIRLIPVPQELQTVSVIPAGSQNSIQSPTTLTVVKSQTQTAPRTALLFTLAGQHSSVKTVSGLQTVAHPQMLATSVAQSTVSQSIPLSVTQSTVSQSMPLFVAQSTGLTVAQSMPMSVSQSMPSTVAQGTVSQSMPLSVAQSTGLTVTQSMPSTVVQGTVSQSRPSTVAQVTVSQSMPVSVIQSTASLTVTGTQIPVQTVQSGQQMSVQTQSAQQVAVQSVTRQLFPNAEQQHQSTAKTGRNKSNKHARKQTFPSDTAPGQNVLTKQDMSVAEQWRMQNENWLKNIQQAVGVAPPKQAPQGLKTKKSAKSTKKADQTAQTLRNIQQAVGVAPPKQAPQGNKTKRSAKSSKKAAQTQKNATPQQTGGAPETQKIVPLLPFCTVTRKGQVITPMMVLPSTSSADPIHKPVVDGSKVLAALQNPEVPLNCARTQSYTRKSIFPYKSGSPRKETDGSSSTSSVSVGSDPLPPISRSKSTSNIADTPSTSRVRCKSATNLTDSVDEDTGFLMRRLLQRPKSANLDNEDDRSSSGYSIIEDSDSGSEEITSSQDEDDIGSDFLSTSSESEDTKSASGAEKRKQKELPRSKSAMAISNSDKKNSNVKQKFLLDCLGALTPSSAKRLEEKINADALKTSKKSPVKASPPKRKGTPVKLIRSKSNPNLATKSSPPRPKTGKLTRSRSNSNLTEGTHGSHTKRQRSRSVGETSQQSSPPHLTRRQARELGVNVPRIPEEEPRCDVRKRTQLAKLCTQYTDIKITKVESNKNLFESIPSPCKPQEPPVLNPSAVFQPMITTTVPMVNLVVNNQGQSSFEVLRFMNHAMGMQHAVVNNPTKSNEIGPSPNSFVRIAAPNQTTSVHGNNITLPTNVVSSALGTNGNNITLPTNVVSSHALGSGSIVLPMNVFASIAGLSGNMNAALPAGFIISNNVPTTSFVESIAGPKSYYHSVPTNFFASIPGHPAGNIINTKVPASFVQNKNNNNVPTNILAGSSGNMHTTVLMAQNNVSTSETPSGNTSTETGKLLPTTSPGNASSINLPNVSKSVPEINESTRKSNKPIQGGKNSKESTENKQVPSSTKSAATTSEETREKTNIFVRFTDPLAANSLLKLQETVRMFKQFGATSRKAEKTPPVERARPNILKPTGTVHVLTKKMPSRPTTPVAPPTTPKTPPTTPKTPTRPKTPSAEPQIIHLDADHGPVCVKIIRNKVKSDSKKESTANLDTTPEKLQPTTTKTPTALKISTSPMHLDTTPEKLQPTASKPHTASKINTSPMHLVTTPEKTQPKTPTASNIPTSKINTSPTPKTGFAMPATADLLKAVAQISTVPAKRRAVAKKSTSRGQTVQKATEKPVSPFKVARKRTRPPGRKEKAAPDGKKLKGAVVSKSPRPASASSQGQKSTVGHPAMMGAMKVPKTSGPAAVKTSNKQKQTAEMCQPNKLRKQIPSVSPVKSLFLVESPVKEQEPSGKVSSAELALNKLLERNRNKEAVPIVQEPAAILKTVHEPAPTIQEPTPIVQEPISILKPAPTVQEPTRTVQEPTPIVEEPITNAPEPSSPGIVSRLRPRSRSVGPLSVDLVSVSEHIMTTRSRSRSRARSQSRISEAMSQSSPSEAMSQARPRAARSQSRPRAARSQSRPRAARSRSRPRARSRAGRSKSRARSRSRRGKTATDFVDTNESELESSRHVSPSSRPTTPFSTMETSDDDDSQDMAKKRPDTPKPTTPFGDPESETEGTTARLVNEAHKRRRRSLTPLPFSLLMESDSTASLDSFELPPKRSRRISSRPSTLAKEPDSVRSRPSRARTPRPTTPFVDFAESEKEEMPKRSTRSRTPRPTTPFSELENEGAPKRQTRSRTPRPTAPYIDLSESGNEHVSKRKSRSRTPKPKTPFNTKHAAPTEVAARRPTTPSNDTQFNTIKQSASVDKVGLKRSNRLIKPNKLFEGMLTLDEANAAMRSTSPTLEEPVPSKRAKPTPRNSVDEVAPETRADSVEDDEVPALKRSKISTTLTPFQNESTSESSSCRGSTECDSAEEATVQEKPSRKRTLDATKQSQISAAIIVKGAMKHLEATQNSEHTGSSSSAQSTTDISSSTQSAVEVTQTVTEVSITTTASTNFTSDSSQSTDGTPSSSKITEPTTMSSKNTEQTTPGNSESSDVTAGSSKITESTPGISKSFLSFFLKSPPLTGISKKYTYKKTAKSDNSSEGSNNPVSEYARLTASGISSKFTYPKSESPRPSGAASPQSHIISRLEYTKNAGKNPGTGAQNVESKNKSSDASKATKVNKPKSSQASQTTQNTNLVPPSESSETVEKMTLPNSNLQCSESSQGASLVPKTSESTNIPPLAPKSSKTAQTQSSQSANLLPSKQTSSETVRKESPRGPNLPQSAPKSYGKAQTKLSQSTNLLSTTIKTYSRTQNESPQGPNSPILAPKSYEKAQTQSSHSQSTNLLSSTIKTYGRTQKESPQGPNSPSLAPKSCERTQKEFLQNINLLPLAQKSSKITQKEPHQSTNSPSLAPKSSETVQKQSTQGPNPLHSTTKSSENVQKVSSHSTNLLSSKQKSSGTSKIVQKESSQGANPVAPKNFEKAQTQSSQSAKQTSSETIRIEPPQGTNLAPKSCEKAKKEIPQGPNLLPTKQKSSEIVQKESPQGPNSLPTKQTSSEIVRKESPQGPNSLPVAPKSYKKAQTESNLPPKSSEKAQKETPQGTNSETNKPPPTNDKALSYVSNDSNSQKARDLIALSLMLRARDKNRKFTLTKGPNHFSFKCEGENKIWSNLCFVPEYANHEKDTHLNLSTMLEICHEVYNSYANQVRTIVILISDMELNEEDLVYEVAVRKLSTKHINLKMPEIKTNPLLKITDALFEKKISKHIQNPSIFLSNFLIASSQRTILELEEVVKSFGLLPQDLHSLKDVNIIESVDFYSKFDKP